MYLHVRQMEHKEKLRDHSGQKYIVDRFMNDAHRKATTTAATATVHRMRRCAAADFLLGQMAVAGGR